MFESTAATGRCSHCQSLSLSPGEGLEAVNCIHLLAQTQYVLEAETLYVFLSNCLSNGCFYFFYFSNLVTMKIL